MNQPNVLVVSDDPEFGRLLLGRWQQERIIPSFTITSSDAFHGPSAPECELAVVGPVRGGRLTPILKTLEGAARPTVCLADHAQIEGLRQTFPRTVMMRTIEGWEDALVLLSIESLRRIEALNRLRKTEQVAGKLTQEAAMGRYVVEVKHGLNNALTSVLGNAELLLLEPNRFSTDVRDQLETIHMMSLKMHEILYRLSSLQQEMQFSERASQSETHGWSSSAAAGD